MTEHRAHNHRICFITLGCAKNEVDSDHMRRQVEQAGFEVVDDPTLAEAVVVNTCSFIQAATEESLEAIFDAADLDSVRAGNAKLIVSGCLPARYGPVLEEELPEVCAFVPCDKEGEIAGILSDILKPTDRHPVASGEIGSRQESVDRHPSAYVKISEGCDRCCTYCTIPSIRGRYHSFTLDSIMAEVASLRIAGVREIVLVAQDTGRWGKDFEEPSSLAALLEKLSGRFEDTWFRVMYLQPDGVDDRLLQVMASKANICSYLDIPIQHVDSAILEAMNRSGGYHELLDLIAHIRNTVPDVTLRTTLISGFPGETEQAFEQLCKFIEEASLDYVGVFPYSREEGTKAAMLPGQVDEETKIERAQELRDIADIVGSAQAAERIGSLLDVLVLGFEEDGQLYGRAQCQAPEVDGVTYLDHGSVGEIVTIRVNDTLFYEMEGSKL